MLLTSQSSIKLNQSYLRVLHFCPAFNDTYMMLAIKHHRTQVLAHLDSNGKIIKQKIFNDAELEQMEMISDREVIVLYNKENLILQWNLETSIFLEIPNLYMEDQIMEMTSLYIFPQTKLLCITQLSNPDHNTIKLTYYRYPFQSQDNIEPIATFQSDQVYNNNNIVRKGNNHSMICWASIQLQKNPQLKFFDLRQQTTSTSTITNINKGKFYKYQLQNCSDWKTFANNNIELSIGNLWEIRFMEFIFIGITNQPYNQQTKHYPCSKFIYSPLKSQFRRTTFSVSPQYNNQHIDSFSCGDFSMIRTYQFEKGLPIKTPIYYISNQTQEILQQQQWFCSHLYKYQLLPSGFGFVQCLYQNGNVQHVTVRVKEMLTRKLIAGFIINQIVQNCDDDLMYQAIALIKGWSL